MVKEYRDDFLGEKAFEKLNKDIDANPTAILVKWNNFFKESE